MSTLSPLTSGATVESLSPPRLSGTRRDPRQLTDGVTRPSQRRQHDWARRYRAKLLATDSAIITASVLSALLFRFGLGKAKLDVGGREIDYWIVASLVVLTWLGAIGAYRTREARVVGIGVTEYRRITSASVLTFGALAIFFFVFKIDVARGFFIVTLPLGFGSLILSRWIWRRWLTKQRKFGHFLAQAIVVGKAKDVAYVIRQIKLKSGAGYDVVGVALKGGGVGSFFEIDGSVIPIISTPDNVAAAARRSFAEAVIVAGQPSGGSKYIRNLGWDLEGSHSDLVLASRLTNVAGPRIHFRPVEGLPLMHVELPQYEGGKHILKRAVDITVSGIAIVLLMPLLAVISLLVHRDSEGPIFFAQDRVGRHETTFRMLKFRSMKASAEDDLVALMAKNEGAGGVLFKLRDDPRVTSIGHVLRRYSLDELPQLWNIFIGDMSLVGPRPPLAREVEQYKARVHRRLFIKPGLTGMWQINGRSNLSWEESVRLDLYYVENWSLTGDVVIMWKTFRVLWGGGTHGAY